MAIAIHTHSTPPAFPEHTHHSQRRQDPVCTSTAVHHPKAQGTKANLCGAWGEPSRQLGAASLPAAEQEASLHCGLCCS